MRPIVLVHGAWGGAWIWKDVAARLRSEGFEVYAPTLSGVGARSHIPAEVVELDTHIEDVAALMRFERLEGVLLVGHSYGGLVITGAADREIARIGAMVYLDAFLPANGQSLWDVLGPEGAERQRQAAEANDGGRTLPYHLARPGEVPPPDRPYTSQPIATFNRPWVSVRPEQTWPHRRYIRCLQTTGPVFRRIAAELQGAPGWSLETFEAAHDVPLTHPRLVAATLADLARRLDE
ncbi:MAG: alpha/beta fold hydrolase [Caulobacteraceae bacterium]